LIDNLKVLIKFLFVDSQIKLFFDLSQYRPGSDAALPNLKKSRRVSIAGGDRKKGGF
jgi:hypothetical protein